MAPIESRWDALGNALMRPGMVVVIDELSNKAT
jgi:hypothetical protein